MLTTGNLLDLTTTIERVFVSGGEVRLQNKQTDLAAKYREKYRQLRRNK